MREIKFRARNKKTGQWHYGGTEPYYGDRPFTIMYLSAFWESIIKGYFDIETVGQYIGLKDKDGKEIYEGDIVRYQLNNAGIETNKTFAISSVIFTRGAFVSHHNHRIHIWALGYICTEDGQLGQVEVIGNIYENPELVIPSLK